MFSGNINCKTQTKKLPYSNNQQTLRWEDDFQTKFMTLNCPMSSANKPISLDYRFNNGLEKIRSWENIKIHLNRLPFSEFSGYP